MTKHEYLKNEQVKIKRQQAAYPVIGFATEDIIHWNELCKARTITEIRSLPQKQQQLLSTAVKVIIAAFPQVDRIYLAGSWVNGSWIDEHTNDEIITLKRKTQAHVPKNSDIDLLVEPFDVFPLSITEFGYKVIIDNIPPNVDILLPHYQFIHNKIIAYEK